jgi:3-oxoacyl-(acyl-carrier-protein) synthase
MVRCSCADRVAGAARVYVVGGGESLSVRVLFEFDNFRVADTEGHDAALVEHATCAPDSASGPTGDEDAVTLRNEFGPSISTLPLSF